MSLLNKLTIFLILGLLMAFIASSVMAHPIRVPVDPTPKDSTNDDSFFVGHLPDTPTHPILESIELIGDAADGYVSIRGFNIKVTFSGAAPIDFDADDLDYLTDWEIRPFDRDGLVWEALVLPNASASANLLNQTIEIADTALVSVIDVAADGTETKRLAVAIYVEPAPATGVDPRRPVVNLLVKSPAFDVTTTPSGIRLPAGVTLALDRPQTISLVEWTPSDSFEFVFSINDFAADPDPTAETLNLRTFDFEPKADLTFGAVRGLGGGSFVVIVTPKEATETIPAKEVGITVSVTDKAGNIGTSVPVGVKLAARTFTPVVDATFTPVVDATFTPAAPDLADLTVPAESYVIIVKSKAGIEGLPLSVAAAEWAGMPDLEYLFYSGGTLALTIAKAADDALFDHDGDGANGSKPRQYKARDLVITEIMAALNDAVPGTPGETAHQWIEVYNPLKVAVSDVKLTAKSGRPALSAASTDVLLDRFSNQVGVGWAFTGLGQDGFDDDAGIEKGSPNVDFVSFYRTQRNKDGHTKGHWANSTEVYLAGHRGTPGVKERSTVVILGNPSTVPTSDNVIFNEIGNFADGSQWIEFKNRKSGTVNLKKWSVGIVTAVGTEVDLFDFPNKNINIPAGGVLLVTEKAFHEEGSQLGLGYDILVSSADQQPGVSDDHPVRYMKQNMGNMPNGNFLLILRTSDNNKHLKTAGGGVQDIAGYYTPSNQVPTDANPTHDTALWPFYRFGKPWSDNNLTEGKVWRRNREGHHGHTGEKKASGKYAWAHAGFTGGVGYKRAASAGSANGGTPGYANNALMGAGNAVTIPVYISEIMYADDGDNARLPQWIEITNPSKSVGVDLHDWRITIVNHEHTYADGESGDTATAEWSGRLEASFLLKGLMIQPNQSVIITSVRALRKDVRLPSNDIFSVWDNSGVSGSRGITGMTSQGNAILNPYGFYITLHANGHENDKNKWQSVDTVGNLAAPSRDRRGNTQPVDPIVWALPNTVDEDDVRSSIARTNIVTDIADNGFDRVRATGTDASDWMLSSEDGRTGRIDAGYYGHKTDLSSPGQTVGSPLPVSLSFFRPTLEDGNVIIRWTTESELDNAGFNILRSKSKNGEFKQVNVEMIQGAGTTGERNTYKWTDTTAKTNVVYYYQIEDVSFAGERQLLTTTRLKGMISAKGKLTTRWADLKNLR